MSKRGKVYVHVTREGTLAPADVSQRAELRRRGYHVGDLLACDITKPRNKKFNGLVHKLGEMVSHNIDEFAGMDSHASIKRLQWEGDIYCSEIGVSMRDAWDQFSGAILSLPGMDTIAPAFKVVGSLLPEKALLKIRQPRSISFETMDESEFQDVAKQICRFISDRYWPDCTAAQIEAMANSGLMIME